MQPSLLATRRRSVGGFTLIEMMITVAIIAILAGIAWPSYLAYVVRNNRVAAQTVLMDIAQRQQQYLLDTRAYATKVSDLSVTVPSNLNNAYAFSIDPPGATPPTFTAWAKAIVGTRQAADGDLSINQAGVKSPAGKW